MVLFAAEVCALHVGILAPAWFVCVPSSSRPSVGRSLGLKHQHWDMDKNTGLPGWLHTAEKESEWDEGGGV